MKFIKILNRGIPWIALAISLISLFNSCNANKYTRQGLVAHLVVKPAQIENGSFVQCKKYEDKIAFCIPMKVKNIGKTTAKNIIYPLYSGVIKSGGGEITGRMESPDSFSSQLSLSPDDEYFLKAIFTFQPLKSENIEQIVKEFDADILSLIISFKVQYEDATTSKKGAISTKYILKKMQSTIIEYDDKQIR